MKRTTTRTKNKSIELFISYSHRDAVWLNRLHPLLQFEYCQEKAYHWDDQKMKAGDRWDKEIKSALERMDVFVCLVSMEFLTSQYIRTIELPVAFEREKRDRIEIVPILIYRNVPVKLECEQLATYNPLPTWNKCWRDFEGEQSDYGDAHGLIRTGLRQAIDKVRTRPLL